jgi:hypothetical protein
VICCSAKRRLTSLSTVVCMMWQVCKLEECIAPVVGHGSKLLIYKILALVTTSEHVFVTLVESGNSGSVGKPSHSWETHGWGNPVTQWCSAGDLSGSASLIPLATARIAAVQQQRCHVYFNKGIVCCTGASSRTLPSVEPIREPYDSVQEKSLNSEHQPSRESPQHLETLWVPCTPQRLPRHELQSIKVRSNPSMPVEEAQPLGMGEPGCKQARRDDQGRLHPSPQPELADYARQHR